MQALGDFFAVEFYGPGNAEGLPDQWPRNVLELRDVSEVPEGWVLMSRAQYQAHVEGLRPAYDAATSGAALESARARKNAEIDRKTEALLAQGFEFPPGSGVRASMSLEAQAKMLAIFTVRDEPETVYPVEWNSLDDGATITLPDSATVRGFVLTAVGTARAIIDGGTSVKNLVRAAQTPEDVEAIVDPR